MTPEPSKSPRLRVTRVEVIDQRNGSDLLVERMGWVGNSQLAPDLRRVRIKSENAFAKRFDDARHPRLKKPRLFSVAAAADEFDATAQLADGDGGKKHRLS